MANSIFIIPGTIATSGSGAALFPDGSAAAPSISFLNEPNSGIYRNGANQFAFDIAGTARVVVGGTGLTIPLNNATILMGASSDTSLIRTAAAVITMNGTFIATLFQTATALVALGGGSAPTLGTIGGSGPATAAQNSWVKMNDSTGAAFWVPVWK